MHPDYRFIQALLDGNDHLIREIYARHVPTLQAWVEKNHGNRHDAKDLAQQVLLIIARQARRPGWQLTCPFGAYFFLLGKRKWLNELQRRRRSGVTFHDFSGLADEDQNAWQLAESTWLGEQREQLFRQKLEALGEGCRRLLQLAWSGEPLEKVAEILGFTYAYVRKKKSECAAKLVAAVQSDPAFPALKNTGKS